MVRSFFLITGNSKPTNNKHFCFLLTYLKRGTVKKQIIRIPVFFSEKRKTALKVEKWK